MLHCLGATMKLFIYISDAHWLNINAFLTNVIHTVGFNALLSQESYLVISRGMLLHTIYKNIAAGYMRRSLIHCLTKEILIKKCFNLQKEINVNYSK